MSGQPSSGSFWDDSTVVLFVGLLLALMVLGGAIAAGLPDDPDPNARPVASVTTTATEPPATTATEPAPAREFERFTLQVTNAGDGRGTISVDGETRDCSDVCRFKLESGTSVTLVARPGTGSTFAGWTEPCDVARRCNVSLDGPETVTALFDRTRPDTTECEDGIDNDVDELIDADDPDCLTSDSEAAPVLPPPPPPPVVTPLPPPPPPPVRPPPPPPPVDVP